ARPPGRSLPTGEEEVRPAMRGADRGRIESAAPVGDLELAAAKSTFRAGSGGDLLALQLVFAVGQRGAEHPAVGGTDSARLLADRWLHRGCLPRPVQRVVGDLHAQPADFL